MDTALVAQWLIETAWQSAALVVLVWVMQMLLRRWLSPAWRCGLWAVVAIRLVMPVLPASGVSVYGLWGRQGSTLEQSTPAVVVASVPRIEVRVAATEVIRPVEMPAIQAPVHATAPAGPTWQSLLVMSWLCVAGLLLVRQLIQAMALRRLRRCATPCDMACAVAVLESDRIRTPALAGLFRPYILLPRGTVERLSAEQLALVLEHELTHLRRGDHWGHAAASVLQAMHWFNPFVYFAISRYRLERELACDRAVLDAQRNPGRRATYGKTLLDLATWTPPRRQFATVAMAEGARHLKTRIREIVADRPGRGSAVAGIVTALLLVICGLTQAQTAETPITAAPPATRPTTAPAPSSAPAKGDDPLERRLPLVSFAETPLQDAVDYLRDKAELNIIVDWPRLEQIGITPEAKVQARLRNVPVSKCLDVLCAQQITAGRDHAAWVFDRGVVTITTRSSLSHAVTKVYDLADIVGTFDQSGQMESGKWLEDVSALLVSTIDSDTWEDHGGSGTIRIFKKNNCLVIRQTEDVHTDVESLLAKLRERAAVSIDVQMRTVELPVKQLPARIRETADKDISLGWCLTDEEVADMVKTARANRQDAVMNAPRMMLMNGGTARVDIWTDVNYLGNVKATTRPGAAPVYEPEISSTKSGIGVTVSAFASHDRKYIRLQLKHQTKRLLSMAEVPYKPVADANESFTIQQPVTNDTSSETDVSVESGKTICLREQVIAPSDGTSEPRAVLLMATPRISVDTTMLAKPVQAPMQEGK